jgi:hypothetical protein
MAQTRFSGPVASDNGFIGNLTGNVTGNLTGDVTGNITGIVYQPAATVAAAGSNQGNAASVTAGFTYVTGADGTKGVKLPTAVGGVTVMIVNAAAQPLKVYPNTSDKINGGTANAAVEMENSTTMIVVALDATDWYTLVFTANT